MFNIRMTTCLVGLTTQIAFTAPQLGIDELSNRGATRNIALSGATAAYPNNHSAVIENPASIPFQPSFVNISIANASVYDSRITSISKELEVKNRSEFEGTLAIRLFDIIGLGGGVITESFRIERQASENVRLGVDVTQTTFPLSVSAHIFNELSLGFSYNIHLAEVARLDNEEKIFGSVASTKYIGNSYKVSALYVVNANVAAAITHQLPASFVAAKTEAPNLNKPSRTQISAVYFVPPFANQSGPFSENTVSAQLDMINFQHEDTIYHPASYLWNVGSKNSLAIDTTTAPYNGRILKSTRYIPKFGVESLLFRNDNFVGQMWLGTHWEPALYADDSARAHMTGGLEISAWFVVVRYALDIAEMYKNQSLGVGVALQF